LQERAEQLQERAEQLQERAEQLQERAEQLEAQFPTLGEIAQQKIEIRNDTASSAHVNAGHKPAHHQKMKNDVPKVELPDTFWNYRTGFSFPIYGINGEPDVSLHVCILLQEIIKALGLRNDIAAMLDVPIMDTAPDVTLTTSCNKVIMATTEVKKPPRTPTEKLKIFGSNTAVAGQAFEELYLCTIQNKAFSVGLISTLGSFQLISNIDVSTSKVPLKPSDAIEHFHKLATTVSCTTPDKQEVLVNKKPPMNSRKKAKAVTTRQPKKESTGKNGRVTRAITAAGVVRKYFASDPCDFGHDEAQNRKVLELLASYVLLCVAAHKEGSGKPLDLTKPDSKCLTREVTNRSFAFKEMILPSGIQFQDKPSKTDSTFYAARQLGYGQCGACCFAFTSNCAPCAIKFYRQHDDRVFEDAKEEAKMWATIYGEYGIDFVRAFKSSRTFLVMPYLSVPCNLSERQRFVQGETKEDSMLYKALRHLASQGYVHREVRWHHVGLWTVKGSGDRDSVSWASRMTNLFTGRRKRSESDESGAFDEVAVFCDLAHVERLADSEEQNQWVKKTFDAMKERIGHVPEQLQLIKEPGTVSEDDRLPAVQHAQTDS
jgi:Family of unknown function (DUF5898)